MELMRPLTVTSNGPVRPASARILWIFSRLPGSVSRFCSMGIHPSPSSAARRIRGIVEGEGRPDLRLRVSVAGGGCSGFQYGFALDDKDEEGDILIERDGAAVVVDGMSLMYVLGAELDYVDDLSGSYFKVQNPNASSSCGCGSSFAI